MARVRKTLPEHATSRPRPHLPFAMPCPPPTHVRAHGLWELDAVPVDLVPLRAIERLAGSSEEPADLPGSSPRSAVQSQPSIGTHIASVVDGLAADRCCARPAFVDRACPPSASFRTRRAIASSVAAARLTTRGACARVPSCATVDCVRMPATRRPHNAQITPRAAHRASAHKNHALCCVPEAAAPAPNIRTPAELKTHDRKTRARPPLSCVI